MLNWLAETVRDKQMTVTLLVPLFMGIQYTKETWPYLSLEYISDV